MKSSLRTYPWWLLLLGGVFVVALAAPVVHRSVRLAGQDDGIKGSPYLRIDPEKIVLNPRDSRRPCGECHLNEYAVWTETRHALNFSELHRSEQAQAILGRMGLRLAKRESLCLRCHYTADLVDGQPRAIAGVSCESCHGAARDWLPVHYDYGGATHETETPEHARMRAEQSRANGMLRPSDDLYAVAANCFECHTVPHEALVNVGGHAAGSAFELLDWADEIRHNFMHTQWSTDRTNRAPSAERRRMMYVLGKALDYEYSLRALGAATTEGLFASAMERRVQKAGQAIDRILEQAEVPALREVRAIGEGVALEPGNGEVLTEVAGQIGEVMRAFAGAHDGSTLAALDPLIEARAAPGAEDEDGDR